MNQRVKQLAAALRELENSQVETLSGALRRVLRLLEMCPWLQDGEPLLPKRIRKPKKPTIHKEQA